MRPCTVLAGVVTVLAEKEHVIPVVIGIVGEVWALVNRVAYVLIELILLQWGPLALQAFLGDLRATSLAAFTATKCLVEKSLAVSKIGREKAAILIYCLI
jgi:hypothetical protein